MFNPWPPRHRKPGPVNQDNPVRKQETIEQARQEAVGGGVASGGGTGGRNYSKDARPTTSLAPHPASTTESDP